MSEPAGAELGMRFARSRALAVLRVRGAALAVALLPAAVAVVFSAAPATGRLTGSGWDTARWVVAAVAAVVLLAAALVAFVVARAGPAVSPTVPIAERTAPDLYRLVRELAERLDVPVPSAVAITPDCDSWLEDRAHLGRGGAGGRRLGARRLGVSRLGVRRLGVRRPAGRREPAEPAPELVVGSPFLWWMRVDELRAVLAPVVAGTGPAAHPDIAAARRFVRGLDAAVAVADRHRALALVGWVTRQLLRGCRRHAGEMERGVAAAASARAQSVDYGLRIVAQEQVGLAYAGWDRLLTRVALPAWRMGRWPARLDAGVVSALTELSRRDRLAEGFASRLCERPACDLLEEPGAVDEAASLLAARLFHGGPAERGPDWAPVDWEAYPEEVVDRKWRLEAARLHRILDELPGSGPPAAASAGPTLARVLDGLAGGAGEEGFAVRLAARLDTEMAREERDRQRSSAAGPGAVGAPWGEDPVPLLPLQVPRSGRELLADHVLAAVCCAAVDTAGAAPGLDWLDGPVLRFGRERAADPFPAVLQLVEGGDPAALRGWIVTAGVRPEKPVRLV